MSRGFKQLRKQRNMTQEEMAEHLEVDIKTIRNWENTEKSIPSIKKMKEIALALDITTYEVFKAFMISKADSQSDFTWNDHSTDFTTDSGPYQFFKYLGERRLLGEGFVIYQYKMFRFCKLVLHGLSVEDDGNSSLEQQIHNPSIPLCGLILFDEAANNIVLTVEEIVSWKIVSKDNDHEVFEIKTTVAFFPEMEQEIKANGFSSFYLNAYKVLSKEKLPYSKPVSPEIIENADNILGRYIKECRERKQWTQEKLSEELGELNVSAKKTTITRWENGSLKPSAYDLAMLHICFGVSLEKILDAFHNGYYSSSAIDENDCCYNVGLHYSFWETKDYDTFLRFVKQYGFYVESNYLKQENKGCIVFNGKEKIILSFQINESGIHFQLDGGDSINVSKENLVAVIPFSLHMSLFYELLIKVRNGDDEIEYSINLVYNLASYMPDIFYDS